MAMINRVIHSRRLRSGVKHALHLTGLRRTIRPPPVSEEPVQADAGAVAPPQEPMRTDANAVADYWTQHNVAQHHAFASAQHSLDYFHWRNDQYFPYILCEKMRSGAPVGTILGGRV
jgi:hypothetical protein